MINKPYKKDISKLKEKLMQEINACFFSIHPPMPPKAIEDHKVKILESCEHSKN